MQETTTTENEGREHRPEREPGHPAIWRGDSRQMGALVFDAALITPEGFPQVGCHFGHYGEGLMPEPCEREAALYVNGIPLCDLHGAEAEAGVRAELYQDAADFFTRLAHAPHAGPLPLENRAVAWAIDSSAGADLGRRAREAERESEAALIRAYPLREDLMDLEARLYDPSDPNTDEPPPEWFYPSRYLIHKLQRLAYEQGATFLVEHMEGSRQSTAVQLAYAIQDAERKAE
jgi:hypothetical protein